MISRLTSVNFRAFRKRIRSYTRRMNQKPFRLRSTVVALLLLLAAPFSFGWGKTGHKMVNRLGAESLPGDVPAFLRAPGAIREIEYLGPEPDRWRSAAEPELNAEQAPDHFIDLEYADMIGPLPRRRYEYIARLYELAREHPEMAEQLRPEKVGFQPYITNEVWERLKSAMRDYRELRARHQSTKDVQRAIIFYAGWLGHYVGDGAQPLHVTRDHDGWVEKENPNGFTRKRGIHGRFETEFVDANITAAEVRPLVAPVHTIGDEWSAYMNYLRRSESLVDDLYELDKKHGFDVKGSADSRRFTAERLAAGAGMFRDLIYAAWVESGEPVPESGK